jgi:hypothetical protein
MRTIIIYVVLLILSSFSLAQNWFPLEVGNKTLGRYSYNYMGGSYVEYYLISIEEDSIINGQQYFYIVNKNISRNHIFERMWERYDSLEQKLYLWYQDTLLLYMDYNVPHGQQFVMINPVSGDSTIRTVFHSTRQLFGNTKNSRGFLAYALSPIMREWIDGFGVQPIGNIIQCIQINNGDTTYFDYGYGPEFNYFTPLLKTYEFELDFIFTINHHYSHTYPPFTNDFIDIVYLDCFYKSYSDSIDIGRLYASSYGDVQRKVHISLDPHLIRSGYTFYYKVTAKDKGLIPKYKSKPDTGYYKLIYDPSPAQILFSEDSIYIPTLADSGSTKIVNTSDYPVRIDSIISVGSFYGYRGVFNKPGFEYQFYLVQSIPGFMGDTLGIIIPPHDSINISFYDVDLCPICDYEVQEYFKDTLRFVFTFMDGNVYSFSKSIPISGEGYPSDNEEEDVLPVEFALHQNYPNPFNPSTKISWQSPVSCWQTIKIFNTLGQEVETIVNEYLEAGFHSKLYIINSTLPSGVYFYQLKAGDPSTGSGQSFIQTKKMLLLK